MTATRPLRTTTISAARPTVPLPLLPQTAQMSRPERRDGAAEHTAHAQSRVTLTAPQRTPVAWWVGMRSLAGRWWPKRLRDVVPGYVAALAIEGCAIALTLATVFAVPGYSLLGAWELVAVALIAAWWGLGPSLAAAVEAVLLLEYVVLPPHFAFKGGDSSQWPEVVLFLLAGLTLSLMMTALTRRYRAAVHAEAQAKTHAAIAREATARMDEFLSVASHEMRNPLAYMLATMQVVERKLATLAKSLHTGEANDSARADERIAEMRELLRRGQRQVRVQDRLIGDMLDASRIRASTFDLRPSRCDLRAIVRDVVEEQRGAWPHREIALEPGPTPGPECGDDAAIVVQADEQRIAQVLANYLTNALKYSPPTAPVSVRVERGAGPGAPVRVLVRDRGVGLPPEERERVWERFHRVPGIQPRDGSGASLGLGLHISRSIIVRHGGQVGVESEPGNGSTFWFALPTEKHAVYPTERAQATYSHARHHARHIGRPSEGSTGHGQVPDD